jgi:uncharacterized protein (UPF0332 family)
MLDENRIKEAEGNVRRYLEEGLLKKEKVPPIIQNTFLHNAQESSSVAEYLVPKSDFWVIIASYYSMFYATNAVLCKLGYKVGDKISHKVTADALIVMVRNKLKKSLLEDFEEAQDEALAGIKAEEIIKSFDWERDKRGRVQYDMTEVVKKCRAEISLGGASTFLFEMEKLLV